MQSGFTEDIDMQAETKFNTLRTYAGKYGVKWGFARNINEKLYISNSDYSDDMSGENWQPLETVLK